MPRLCVDLYDQLSFVYVLPFLKKSMKATRCLSYNKVDKVFLEFDLSRLHFLSVHTGGR